MNKSSPIARLRTAQLSISLRARLQLPQEELQAPLEHLQLQAAVLLQVSVLVRARALALVRELELIHSPAWEVPVAWVECQWAAWEVWAACQWAAWEACQWEAWAAWAVWAAHK